jgi:hypothetical protein
MAIAYFAAKTKKPESLLKIKQKLKQMVLAL